MKRLIKKISKKMFEVGDQVRLIENKDDFYEIIGYEEEEKKYIVKKDEVTKEVFENKLMGEHDFFEGDRVAFKKPDFKTKGTFTVKDVLQNGTYLLENEEKTLTNINGKKIILQK